MKRIWAIGLIRHRLLCSHSRIILGICKRQKSYCQQGTEREREEEREGEGGRDKGTEKGFERQKERWREKDRQI